MNRLQLDIITYIRPTFVETVKFIYLITYRIFSINLKLRRVGGSFGQKISRCSLSCAACSLAAVLLQRPVRINMELESVMESAGKRSPVFFKYEVNVMCKYL